MQFHPPYLLHRLIFWLLLAFAIVAGALLARGVMDLADRHAASVTSQHPVQP